MEKLSPLDITDSSIQVFNSSDNHIYEYANPNVTIVDAQNIADDYLLGSKYSGHILTIDSEQERSFFSGSGEFQSLINDYVGVSWLGINLENDEWVYSSLNSDLTSTVDYFNWG